MSQSAPITLAAAVLAAAVATASRRATAQETIFDPENPAVDTSGDDSSEDDDSSDDDSPDDDQGASTPRLTSAADGQPASTDATFLGSYATSLAVDSSWDGHGEDIVAWNNAFSLRLDYDMPGRSRAVVEGDFLHWMVGKQNRDDPNYLLNATRGRASYEARLGPAYVLFRSGNWSVRLGNLVTRWASTSLVRPADVVNPVDLSQSGAVGPNSETALPQWTAEVAYSTPTWSLTGLVVPFFEPNDVVVFGRDRALLSPFNPLIGDQYPLVEALEQIIDPSRWDDVQSIAAATEVPDETPTSASVGGWASLTKWHSDFGVGYFYGWDRTPWIEVDDDLGELVELAVDDGQVLQDFDAIGFAGRHPRVVSLSHRLGQKAAEGQTLFRSEYRRRHTFAVDFARYLGPIGVRADVAFSPEQTLYSDTFEPLRRSTVFGALGLSWERIQSQDDILSVTIEGFWLHPFGRDTGVNRFFVAAAERGPKDAQLLLVGDNLYGAATAVGWAIPVIETMLRVGAVTTISTRDVVATASLSRQWFGWLRTTVGATILEGPDPADTDRPVGLGGLYDHDDQVRLTIDGRF